MIGVICEAFARTSGATGKAGEGIPEKVSARGKMEKDALGTWKPKDNERPPTEPENVCRLRKGIDAMRKSAGDLPNWPLTNASALVI
jgi:hypothetical protein